MGYFYRVVRHEADSAKDAYMWLVRKLLPATLLFMVSACSAASITGTVTLAPMEGGCWLIKGDNKVTYQILNLPIEFQHDGLRVVTTLKTIDVATICMVGTPAEIGKIQRK